MTGGDSYPLDFTDRPSTSYTGPERRGKPRLYWRWAAMVRGIERGGGLFEIKGVVSNISASGLYLQLGKRVEPGAALFLAMRFTNTLSIDARGPLITIHGRVLRVEARPDVEFGVALAIEQHEFV